MESNYDTIENIAIANEIHGLEFGNYDLFFPFTVVSYLEKSSRFYEINLRLPGPNTITSTTSDQPE